jgi:hypothetical protein
VGESSAWKLVDDAGAVFLKLGLGSVVETIWIR